MAPTRIAWMTFWLATLISAVLYWFILTDAVKTGELIHIMTLTPLMPFLLVMALAYRHRHGTFPGWVLLTLVLILGGLMIPLFWTYFTPETTLVTKALVKGALPIGLTFLAVLVGAGLEWHRRRTARAATSPTARAATSPTAAAPKFSKY